MIRQKERRKFTRLLPRNTAFGIFRPNFYNLGKVKDVSINGLALEYILNETIVEGFSEIDIFLTDDFLYLRRIPCKIIYIIEIDVESQSLKTRRCGVQFGDLTPTKKSQIEYFIQHFTSGELNSH